MLINNDGFYYNIIRDTYESLDIYYSRAWFIVKLKPRNLIELNNFIHYSFLWVNIKYKECIYSRNIHDKINELESK